MGDFGTLTGKTNTSMTQTYDHTKSLSHWIFEKTQSFIAGRVLEITTYSGNIEPECKKQSILVEVLPINLEDSNFDQRYSELGQFDTVIALYQTNQLINNPSVIANCSKLITNGGYLLTLLTARTALYQGLEQGLREWIDDNYTFIDKILRPTFKIIKLRYFVHLDQEDWIIKNNPSEFNHQREMIYKDIPIFFIEEDKSFFQKGLSIVVVGMKK